MEFLTRDIRTKEQLFKELNILKKRLAAMERGQDFNHAVLSECEMPSNDEEFNGDKIEVSEIDVEWQPQEGTCTFESLPVAMMWIDSTLDVELDVDLYVSFWNSCPSRK